MNLRYVIICMSAASWMGCESAGTENSDELGSSSSAGPGTAREGLTSSRREPQRSHPILTDNLVLEDSNPNLLTEVDSEGFGWTIEEGTADYGDGKIVRTSGLRRVQKIKTSPEKRGENERRKGQSRQNRLASLTAPRLPILKIDSALYPQGQGDGTEQPLVEVLIRVASPPKPPIAQQLEQLMLDGTIESADDIEQWEQILLDERATDVELAQQSVSQMIDSLGGQVTYQYTHLFGLDALLSNEMILAVSLLPDVEVISANHELVESTDGVDVLGGTQIQQFIDGGFDGEYGTDAQVAVIEINPLADEHVGFRETAIGTRIGSRWVCDNVAMTPCTSLLNYPVTAQLHPIAVAGILLGDLRDGQDATVPVPLDRAKRSGYAGEAKLHMYQAQSNILSLRKALDHIVSATPKRRIVNMSVGDEGDDPFCEGESLLSGDANDVFEAGSLIVFAAGNRGHAIATDCLVNSPGSAIGVFTVGGHGNSSAETIADVRTGVINTLSPMGGGAIEGKGRTIINTSGYACRDLLFDAAGGYGLSGCGTSYSAPTVSAAAVDYSDWYKSFNAGSTFIDSPGVMFTQLLIFGDRQAQIGKLTSGFDPLWGAGRLKMRKGDGAGMDSPYLFKVGSTCVDDGEEVVVSVNMGAVLSADVDDLKGVIYWYDHQHYLGTQIDDIDLLLEHTDNSIIRASDGVEDNKERVYTSTAGSNAWQLRIVGANVTADNAGCGVNSMLVYWSYFYEDDDRDDGDGPNSTVAAPE